jgi:hypothetical protein
MSWTRRVSVAALFAVVATLTACSRPDQSPIVVPVPSFTPTTTSAAARIVGTLPAGCGAVAAAEEVSDAIARSLPGQPRLVTGAPDPKIGRTARLDCYYGLGDGQPITEAPVAVGLASYADMQAANRRVTATVDSERAAGAKVSDVPVGPDTGILMVGKKIVTLVATHQSTTVVVTVPLEVVPAERAAVSLAKIADRALSPR